MKNQSVEEEDEPDLNTMIDELNELWEEDEIGETKKSNKAKSKKEFMKGLALDLGAIK